MTSLDLGLPGPVEDQVSPEVQGAPSGEGSLAASLEVHLSMTGSRGLVELKSLSHPKM